jgi:hypothetical protein
VAVAFGLETIGDVDWYAWGVSGILPGQQGNGSWMGGHGEIPATCFAVLFLAKSNFVSDLTRNIRGKVKDPGKAELRGARNVLNSGGSNEAVRTPGAGGGPGATGTGDPALSQIAEKSEAEKEAEKLVGANETKWAGTLKLAKEGKGGQYTAALVRAIPQLEGKRQYQVREALIERLTRMTAETLKKYLSDRDQELRRAAAIAWAMRDDKAAVPELIELLEDTDEAVIRAAKAGLKSLTGEDFGPATGANDDQRREAMLKWRTWYRSTGRGR